MKPHKLYGYKNKDLIGIPWLLAFALRDAGWYLRQDIIWHKPNPMPESVTDRCTKAHEYIFLFTKSPRYWFDHEAMLEPANYDGRKKMTKEASKKYYLSDGTGLEVQTISRGGTPIWRTVDGRFVRNRRSVWMVPTRSFKGAHFATFPPGLIRTCIERRDVLPGEWFLTHLWAQEQRRLWRENWGVIISELS
jgi:DNA modification methylase